MPRTTSDCPSPPASSPASSAAASSPAPLTLIGGDPGVGKSTLLTQLAADIASNVGNVLYVPGEESLAQVGLRARRMGLQAPDLSFLSATDAETIVATAHATRPRLLIVDSIQSVMVGDVDGLPGSVSQLRESAQQFMQLAKSSGIPVFLVGHVTKDGSIAGPKLLEHMVDTVLYLEGERVLQYRLLRSVKNRSDRPTRWVCSRCAARASSKS